MMDFSSAFNEIIKFFIENGTIICDIDKINIPGLNGNQILQIIEKVPTFFRLVKIGNQTIIKIYIDIKACDKYNLSIHCNHNLCQELHICKQKLLNSRCKNESCKLNHTLKFFQTKNILANLNINGSFDLVLKFFQVFSNNAEEDDNKSSFSQNNMSTLSSRDKIEIQIRLPKNFIEEGSRKLLNEIFSDSFKSGGGPTVKCKYLPNKWKAYIAFKDDSVAEKLISTKEVKYRNYHFAISKTANDYGKNDESNNKTNLNTDSEHKNYDSSNSNILLIKNAPNDKNKTDILRFAAIIARLAPNSANLIDNEKGIWKVQFDRNLDRAELENNFKLVRNNLPSEINIDTSYIEKLSVQFDNHRNRTELENNFELINKNLPSAIDTSNDQNLFKNQKLLKNDKIMNYNLVKDLKYNIFLKMVLNEKNLPWKNELIEGMKNFNCSISVDPEFFRVFACHNPQKNLAHWKKEVDNVLKQFFRNFETKSLTYNIKMLELIYLIKKKFEELKMLFLIDYFDDAKESKFHFMIKKIHYNDLKIKCAQLNELTDFHTNEEEDTKKKENKPIASKRDVNSNFLKSLTKEPSTNKSIKLPQISYVTYKSLYFNSIERIKKKYFLEDYSIDRDSILSITGTVIDVNKSIELVNKISNSIRIKKIDGMSINFFKCKTLPQITEDLLLSLVDKLFTVEVKLIDGPNLPGFYVSYIQNLEEIDCPNDSVFDQASSFIKENLYLEEINVTSYSDVLISEKWKIFERNNLRSELMGTNFWVTVYAGFNNQNFVLICGKKDYVQANKLKIEAFLANNEKNTLEIPVDFINAEFIKLTSSDEIKNIEKKFEVKIEVICDKDGMSSKIVVKNHPKNLNQIIEREIKSLMSMRQKGVIFSEYFPAFDKLLNDKKIGIQNTIKNIQDQTKTVIECSAVIQEETENLNIQAENLQINDKKSDLKHFKSYFSVPSANQNKVLTVLKIGNSVLRLEVGCITKTKADVIVSTNSKSLNLGSGVLSKLLVQAAGSSVIDEAKNNYPNGINNNSIAITSAGRISGVKYLFHAALSHFVNELNASKAIESIINASFIELRSNGLTSISLPALGAGGFGFPSNLVSKQMIECISNFLKMDKNSLNVNIVLHEKETELIKNFEYEFLSCEKPHLNKMKSEEKKLKDLNHKISFSNLKAKGKFTIYFKSKVEYNAALSQLKVFIADEFKRESLNESNMKNLTSLTVKDLQELFFKYPDIEIEYENKSLNLFGYKNIVWSAKAELALLINNKMAGHFSSMIEQMKVSTDIQWQFLSSSNDWKNFSVYLNSLIESTYLKKGSQVNFEDESNQMGTIFFNMEPMVYLIDQTRINVRRIDIAKLGKDSFDLPSNWISTNSGNEYDLVDLKTDSNEFQNVYNHFKSKLQNNSVTISKIQRIQNKYLFKQFQIFKEKFINEKKNPNEMTLFHGSTEDSLLKICRFGFNRSFCGINGVAFGQGVYFAVNSAYSLNYSSRGHHNHKCMIQAKVIVGQSCLGNSQMRVPPTQPNTLIPYDSTCDQGRSIFVCYHDNQCYPEYLIYFI